MAASTVVTVMSDSSECMDESIRNIRIVVFHGNIPVSALLLKVI